MISGRFRKKLLLFAHDYLVWTESSSCRCVGHNRKNFGAYWLKNERGVILREGTRFKDRMEGLEA